jgi:hypothetical protein
MLLPVALITQWRDELIKFLGPMIDEKRDICVIRKGSDHVTGRICLLPYTLIDKMVEKEKITKEQFGIVIADESHNIKSKDSKRTNVALPFIKAAKVAVCLTGTPATNRPVELYTQLNALLPSVFNDYEQFTLRYCDAKPNRFGPGLDVTGSSNEAELKLLLEGMVMIRRLKADVINNLPNKLRELRYVSVDPAYEREMKELEKRDDSLSRSINNPSVDINTIQQMRIEQRTLLNARYQITGMSKIASIKHELIRLIEEAKESQESSYATAAAASAAAKRDEEDNKPAPTYPQPVIMTIEDDEIMTESVDVDHRKVRQQQQAHQTVTILGDDDDDELVDSDNDHHRAKFTSTSRHRLKKTAEVKPAPSKKRSLNKAFIIDDDEDEDEFKEEEDRDTLDDFIASDDDFEDDNDENGAKNYKLSLPVESRQVKKSASSATRIRQPTRLASASRQPPSRAVAEDYNDDNDDDVSLISILSELYL